MIFRSMILTMLLAIVAGAQARHSFGVSKTEFLLDGEPFQIRGCELHPARIPHEYWRFRIRMAKALGCNSISVYIFWNFHEDAAGRFDFVSPQKNIGRFLKMIQAEGMWALLRPGPYVCAEWDFGGIPARLLAIPDIKIRGMDPRYIAAVKRYFAAFAPTVRSNLITNGGNVLMVQIENEYGSYGNDKRYLELLRSEWKRLGVNVPFYTADGATPYMLEAGNIDGAVIGLDSGSNDKDFEQAYKRNPNVPAFSSESYPGWLTHWGEKWAKPDPNEILGELEYLMSKKRSFCLYVAHGGTNFGFWAGANAANPTQYQPDVTSYDYDAPIDERGQPTEKFFKIRDLIARHLGESLPEPDSPLPMVEIPKLELKGAGSLFDLRLASKNVVQPVPMESLGQYTGLISYKTKLIGHKSGKLKIWEPHDFALVYLDGKLIKTVYRDGGDWTVDLPRTDSAMPELEIVVEAMGRINYGQFMIDRKGITDRVTLNNMTLMDWKVTQYPMDETFVARALKSLQANSDPARGLNFYRASFDLDKTGDAFIDTTGWKKGMVYVNGHNLGRFWEIGPQTKLYCPASWLREGRNEIIVFDLIRTP
ncbi:MAG: beta-galactosidase [Acidobacteria bacterium]|nr:beta-galactosidase [Acidobacteriota bacterium]